MRISFLASSIATACLAATCALAPMQQSAVAQNNNSNTAPPPKKNERPAAVLDAAREPFDGASVEKMAAQCVRLETEAGEIEMEMLPETAPETVRNFLNLSAIGAFDGTTFHRTVKGFIIQGGSLASKQPLTLEQARRMARVIPDEPNPVKHVRGIVSMARSDKPNTATSSFFILVGDGPRLDGMFAAFARVTRGMEAADAINNAPAEEEKPAKPVRLKRALVTPCPPPSTQP
ncbi:MAG TPA: peptidylprolyl isomerase [Pyrinomonadaceae bacterium]